MYFVDRKKIENALVYMEDLHDAYSQTTTLDSLLKKLALERMAQGWIEAIIDVGNQMIDGFIMRDPGSYEDIIDILDDEKVIKPSEADSLKKVIGLRKMLVQDFTKVDHTYIQQTLKDNLRSITVFPERVRKYLEQELGPVSAFLPDE
ncbi:type VII toxin-antitoxin system HepT family RNase toxin [Alteribacillus iranensis]|uniref:Uncharacterized conserved protein YutE, UPF0331/DUF86 family n=1 Tax=Alteribacillus iranensis TaxID=930128 RepID=A0A1I2EQE4_9BACI|nr:DUF86 domain-containing protein [Alteribacillus iranensis]SFE94716.1 Uncharacterized conserved protein YutE, UPF0331/DUF86 family [Alteribacillus iranensis]